MDVTRNHVDRSRFNSEAVLAFQLRLDDFALAMQDIYELGTRTATLHRQGIEKLRQNWIYKLSV